MHVRHFPCQFDYLFLIAEYLERHGRFALAGYMYLFISSKYDNLLWMQLRAANALWKAGRWDESLKWIGEVNQIRPTVASYLVEARIWRSVGHWQNAIKAYSKAKEILEK